VCSSDLVFRRLDRERIRGIVGLQIAQLGRLLEQKDLTLTVTPEAIGELAREGYDPVYGARPLKRLIQKKIQDRLALMLLEGEIVPGDAVRLDVDAASGELVFGK
jgi:ATP-dependent Clp protease ATP-binding subunit ClpA